MVLNPLEIPIYYINLDDQPERNEAITKRLSENESDRMKFVLAANKIM